MPRTLAERGKTSSAPSGGMSGQRVRRLLSQAGATDAESISSLQEQLNQARTPLLDCHNVSWNGARKGTCKEPRR